MCFEVIYVCSDVYICIKGPDVTDFRSRNITYFNFLESGGGEYLYKEMEERQILNVRFSRRLRQRKYLRKYAHMYRSTRQIFEIYSWLLSYRISININFVAF